MTEELGLPTLDLLESLREMKRQWELNGRRLDSPGRLPSGPVPSVAPIVQAIEVTSSTADAYGYPARIQLYDGTNWTDTYAECRAVQIGSTIAGAVLATGFYPPGRLMSIQGGFHVYGVHPGSGIGAKAKWIYFTLPSALAVTDASKASCTVTLFCQGSDPGATVTVWNMPASTNYIFSGASGNKGAAFYDDINDKYRIIQLECP